MFFSFVRLLPMQLDRGFFRSHRNFVHRSLCDCQSEVDVGQIVQVEQYCIEVRHRDGTCCRCSDDVSEDQVVDFEEVDIAASTHC